MAQESGYNGVLISLGGVKGAPNRGRYTVANVRTMTAAPYPVAPSNSRRLSLVIANLHTDYMRVYFGRDFGTSYIQLQPGQSIQIDSDLPWTGDVYVDSPVSAGVVNYVEVSVQ